MKFPFLLSEKKNSLKKKLQKRSIFKADIKKRASHIRKKILPLFLFFLLMVISYFFLFSSFFRLKTIVCKKNSFSCSDDEKNIFDGYLGKNIFFINLDNLEKIAKLKNLNIDNLVMSKQLPERLFVTLNLRKPAAILLTDKGGFLVDSTGFVYSDNLEKEKPSKVIQTQENSWVVLGSQAGDDISKALDLTRILDEFFIPSNELILEKNGKILLTGRKYEAIFTSTKDLRSQVVSLQLILQSSKINRKFANIDLRFEKPVVNLNE